MYRLKSMPKALNASTRATGSHCYATLPPAAARSTPIKVIPRRGPSPRELPKLQNKLPLYIGTAAFACLAWAGFLSYAMNYERASSSVVRTLITKVKKSPRINAALGGHVKPVPHLFSSDPWISGSVNLLQGSVDVSFPIAGDKGTGTALFTSIRRTADSAFEILRWKVILPDGQVVDLMEDSSDVPITVSNA